MSKPPTPELDTPKTPPAPTPDKLPTPKPDTSTLLSAPGTPKAKPAPTLPSAKDTGDVLPQSRDTSESKPTASHGVFAHRIIAPDHKPVPMPEPTTPLMQNSKKTTTPTQKPSHTSAKRASDKRSRIKCRYWFVPKTKMTKGIISWVIPTHPWQCHRYDAPTP
ncbi:hypothetical protein PR002_g17649 [Phytophthora rubi]|uniref:Uncharacterized protein n=1 Tax=Phytophthora rubi TaxID=129364 RepID=A0A6A3K3Z6_9STRA|nr:hypothetical protein PR002_g17649 [Phytophthora rubi]